MSAMVRLIPVQISLPEDLPVSPAAHAPIRKLSRSDVGSRRLCDVGHSARARPANGVKILDRDRTGGADRTSHTATTRDPVTPTDAVFFEGMTGPARLSWIDRLDIPVVTSRVGNGRGRGRIAAWAGGLAPLPTPAPT